MPDPIVVFMCGDVMTGRGIDQILPHPGDPALYEPCVRDARDYVRLAEAANGPIPLPVEAAYVWGDALGALDRAGADARLVNLETSITRGGVPWPDKHIHYRMHPENIGCLRAAGIDCCCLANNHVLDWGRDGLAETLRTLEKAGIAHAGAGRDAVDASSPAEIEVPDKGRLLVFSLGAADSGIPSEWRAKEDQSGVCLLADLSENTARSVARAMRERKQSGDVVLASIHWGGNWGYEIPGERIAFAHRLIEEGVDVVHGHSAHHVQPLEVYRDRLILYGCGDFINDYEGIRGYEEFRCDLRLGCLLWIDPVSGRLVDALLVPLQSRRFRLNQASAADTKWLCNLLNRLGRPFGARLRLEGEHNLRLRSQ